MADETVEIAASALGTQEFWDARYELELRNFESTGDEGEVWFGRSAENRMLKYVEALDAPRDAPILDLGCGNGSLLRRLAAKGFTALTGVDYSETAVQLARRISASEGFFDLTFRVLDVLSASASRLLAAQYTLVLDKGTWDAMSLCAAEEREARRLAYAKVLDSALRPGGGRFVIVSCNFTKDELCTLFSSPSLEFEAELPTQAVFAFGGKQGTTSTGAVFRKL